MTVNPISPSEAKKYLKPIPDFVIQSFNDLIQENFNGQSAKFTQDLVLERIVKNSPAVITQQEICKRHWLDIEVHYETAGWKVVYDKPGYNEFYSATFEFFARKEE